MDRELKQRIQSLASKYETKDFLPADPSSFMHKVEGAANQEATAFLASCLSYGSRKQFFPKIQFIVDAARGEVDHWVRSGEWRSDIPDTSACYYRLYTFHDMHCLIAAYEKMLGEWGSMREFVAGISAVGTGSAEDAGSAVGAGSAEDAGSATCPSVTGIEAVAALCDYFAKNGAGKVVPKNTTSACKRVCMFLRWMVRTGSPVDLGLWADLIDRRTLIMPLDTHVVQEACKMGLLSSRTASMATARRLTDAMLEVFPEDPLKGDFALFGLGVEN